jgi:methylthioribose-1-phosphate isomerase
VRVSTILAAGGRVTDLLAVRCAPAIGVAGAFGVVLAGDDAADQRVWLPMG